MATTATIIICPKSRSRKEPKTKMKYLISLLIFILTAQASFGRKDTIYFEPNIRIVYSAWKWKQLYRFNTYTSKKRKTKFTFASYLFPGSTKFFEGHINGGYGTVKVNAGYLSEFTSNFYQEQFTSLPAHLHNSGYETDSNAPQPSEVVARKIYYVKGKKYELFKKRNWHYYGKKKKNQPSKLKHYYTFEAVLDTTFNNASYLHIEWESTDSFFHLKSMLRSFSNIEAITSAQIDSIHNARMADPEFQVKVNSRLNEWKVDFAKNIRGMISCSSTSKIDELAMHMIPLDTIQFYQENFNYEAIENRIVKEYEEYARKILHRQIQYEEQFGYSKSREMAIYQNMRSGGIPLTDLLNELTEAPVNTVLDTLKVFTAIENVDIQDLMFSSFYADSLFETTGARSFARKLEDMICRQYAKAHFGYKDSSVIKAVLMNSGDDFRNYCYFIEKENQPDEEDIYLVTFQRDSLYSWSDNFVPIQFDPFQTGNSRLIPFHGGYFLPGPTQSVILETGSKDQSKITVLERNDTLASTYPTLVEVEVSEIPNNEPAILSIQHQRIEHLTSDQQEQIKDVIKTSEEYDDSIFPVHPNAKEKMIEEILSKKINAYITPEQRLYRQNYYLADITGDGKQEIIQYDVSNGSLISWSAFISSENSFIPIPDIESKQLLEKTTDVRNLKLFSQLIYSLQSAKP